MDSVAAGSTSRPVEGLDIVLRDGSTVYVRPAAPSDEAAVRAFLKDCRRSRAGFASSAPASLSSGRPRRGRPAVCLSWSSPARTDTSSVRAACAARAGRAEVAFAVADAWQAHGIATILLAHLADAAADEGIRTFTASVLPSNHRMIGVLRDSGYPVELRSRMDEITVLLPTTLTPKGRLRFEERERTAAIAAVKHVLQPASIAVVGASRRRGTVGGEVFHNLLSGGYAGALYAVNRKADEVQGVRAFPSLADVPGPVELAVIAVPAAQVVELAQTCAERNVRAARRTVGRLCGTRARRRHAAARTARHLPIGGDANGRPQLSGSAEHSVQAQRDVRPGQTTDWPRGLRLTERSAGASRRSTSPPSAGWGCPRSCHWATGPICRATTSCSTGAPTPTPTRFLCTWSRSGIPVTSDWSPATSLPPSR